MRIGVMAAAFVFATGGSASAAEQSFQKQYRAAMTKLLLERSAFAVFESPDLAVSNVLSLEKEFIRHSDNSCFPSLIQGEPVAIEDYSGEHFVEISLGAGIGVALNKVKRLLGKLSVDVNYRILEESMLRISDFEVVNVRPNVEVLFRVDESRQDCKIISDVLRGASRGRIIAARVYTGRPSFVMTYELSAGADAEVGKKTAKEKMKDELNMSTVRFALNGKRLQQLVLRSSEARSLAVTPLLLNARQLAAVTAYLRGRRGAELEEMVLDAIRTEDVDTFESLRIRIAAKLGDRYVWNENWARQFLEGEELVPYPNVYDDYEEGEIDVNVIGTYGAAHELLR